MKVKSFKTKFTIILGAVSFAALIAGVCAFGNNSTAFADNSGKYNESYRNRLVYSAEKGWNNDPNGLLYVDGTYHMYYQYTWKDGQTKPWWDDMSWGHATSTDLVNWTEQPVAIPAYQTVGEKYYGMMFSGSAVYDENNTSGLFETENGKLKDGQGITAILTQPDDGAGGQRQILAYSKDGGQSFEIYGEILGANAEGSLGDGEFRDPKVFWNEKLNKWLMTVGGGSVRMYSSANLKEWTYLGETGYWGECPDISKYTVDGEEKYVLVISPEDKAKSHEYNGTNRAETYYPAEYYVVGDLNEKGLFVSDEPLIRLSEGIDSYAFQSFNGAPDGKVYGVSWSASWKSVGEYENIRKTYNGGMTAVCELNLIKENGEYRLTRNPVESFNSLRGEIIKEYTGELEAGKNALAGFRADMADLEISLDFTDCNATYAQLDLRVSATEKISLRYDVTAQTLTLDRSASSLLAENTALYKIPYTADAALENGKLTLRILLDRAFISVFANGGKTTFFSAVFPSAISDSMRLLSDGNINVNARIYSVNGIFGNNGSVDELILTAEKIDTTVGATEAVIASSYADDFDASEVQFTAVSGGGNIKIEQSGGTAYIKALKKGSAEISVSYRGQTRNIAVYIYNNGFESEVSYGMRLGGFSYISDGGLYFATGQSDAFLFGNASGENFVYSANFRPAVSGAQAGGLVFGVSGNYTDYLVATADLKDGKIKLWKSGVGDLKTADYSFGNAEQVKLTVAVSGGVAKIYVNGDKTAAIVHKLEGFSGGTVGLNVYNAEMLVNGVSFLNLGSSDNSFALGENTVLKVVNVTDGSYRLGSGDYVFSKGSLSINPEYLSTLENDTEYTFRVITAFTDFDVTVRTDFAPSVITAMKDGYARGDALTLAISGGVEVYKVEIDGVPCEFKAEGEVISVSSEVLEKLISGTHTVKAYTAKGRPQTEFSIVTQSDFRDEDIAAVTHTFLYVDIAIFASLVLGYAVISFISKRRAK